MGLNARKAPMAAGNKGGNIVQQDVLEAGTYPASTSLSRTREAT
jgi:hypothetical protein